MKHQKKVYNTPKINRVKLVAKTAVLSICHASPVMTAELPNGCQVPAICYGTTPGPD